ncbi:hypothetical protein IMG5_060580 [Ichthyophthirius multifiliis]|uniref:Archaemetzincin-2 n=1 Tax=Ichthyophthirius multifiliis TaxID=5932 RepID=G0QNP6_ICHMU|nr:hypothetical protein IMG5_060580 [Ichthyophthirius multifiliis]EGR33165.1 hypothetical protein IMG5_060580 [Ichthyophthirius multifiliis]|eukprot:XP_004037151.1 hypothetical protein IMG5_060580 [Ichthyophthirius multifiliis]
MDQCQFKVPDLKQRQQAIGSLAGTPIKLKKAIQSIMNKFQQIKSPNLNDWLWDHDEDGQNFEIIDDDVMIYRACKIMSHEICHMLGMKHCIFYHCLMNGANHQQEMYQQPLQLCVVCRYQGLMEFCQKMKVFNEKDSLIYKELYQTILEAYGKYII